MPLSLKCRVMRSRRNTPMSLRRALPLLSGAASRRLPASAISSCAGALGDHDHRVPLPLQHALQASAGTRRRPRAQRDLGDQDEVRRRSRPAPRGRRRSRSAGPSASPGRCRCAPRSPRRGRRGSTSTAAEKALSKPKLRSMKWMSLSMVLGMPTTAIFRPRRSISAASCMAPRDACRRRRPRTGCRCPAPRGCRPSRPDPASRATSPGWCRPGGGCAPPTPGVSAHRLVAEAGDQALVAVAKAEDVASRRSRGPAPAPARGRRC